MSSTILVTGANKGIGYEAVKLLSQRLPQSTILLGSRSVKNGNEAIEKMKSVDQAHDYSNIKVVEIDITSESSLKAAVEHVKSTYKTLDVLLHNSGISNIKGEAVHPEIFNVNIRGAKATIEAFEPILTPDKAKIIVVSSEVGPWYMKSLQDSDAEVTRQKLDNISNVTWEKIEGWMKDWEAHARGEGSKEKWTPLDKGLVAGNYCASKGLLNPWVRKYAADHASAVAVAIVCPGYCATELNNFQGHRTAEQGGESVIWPIFNDFKNGEFYQDGKQRPFTSVSYDA